MTSHYNVLTLILENRGQCDVTLQRLIPIKTMSVLKISTYIITTRPSGLGAMLAIMSVSTFKTVVILYVSVSLLLLIISLDKIKEKMSKLPIKIRCKLKIYLIVHLIS